MCSAINLIGQHVGHTTPRTRTQLHRGIGKVLVIRDIHRISRDGYTSEALDTRAEFAKTFSKRMVIVLVGPPKPLDDLLGDRPELRTLFPDSILFNDLAPLDCLRLLDRLLIIDEPGAQTPFFTSDDATEKFRNAMAILTLFERWNNSWHIIRVKTFMLQKGDAQLILATASEPTRKHEWVLTADMAMSCFKSMFNELRATGGEAKRIVVEDASDAEKAIEAPESKPAENSESTLDATSAPEQLAHARHHGEQVAPEKPQEETDAQMGENKLEKKEEAVAESSSKKKEEHNRLKGGDKK